MRSLLVFVSGPPGAGKTTIARVLAPRLHLPLVAKDDIKEALFDSLGWSDIDWSKKLGAAAWDVLFVQMERFISAGASAIFEANFYPKIQRQRLLEMQARLGLVPFEVYCTADAQTLARRNNERDRHPGHHWSSGVTPELATSWALDNAPLELSEHVVRVDTGAAEPVDLDGIVTKISQIRRIADGI